VPRYLEYNSTTRLSLIVEGRSERAGSALNVPFISLALTSIHSGKPRVSAAATEPLTRSCSFVLGATSTVRQCRREAEKLFLRAEKCLHRTKCAIERRSYAPDSTGRKAAAACPISATAAGEAEAAPHIRLLERQFRKTYAEASRSTRRTGRASSAVAESRLDTVRTAWARREPHRARAKSCAITHLVNGKRRQHAFLPGGRGDTVEVAPKTKEQLRVKARSLRPKRAASRNGSRSMPRK